MSSSSPPGGGGGGGTNGLPYKDITLHFLVDKSKFVEHGYAQKNKTESPAPASSSSSSGGGGSSTSSGSASPAPAMADTSGYGAAYGAAYDGSYSAGYAAGYGSDYNTGYSDPWQQYDPSTRASTSDYYPTSSSSSSTDYSYGQGYSQSYGQGYSQTYGQGYGQGGYDQSYDTSYHAQGYDPYQQSKHDWGYEYSSGTTSQQPSLVKEHKQPKVVDHATYSHSYASPATSYTSPDYSYGTAPQSKHHQPQPYSQPQQPQPQPYSHAQPQPRPSYTSTTYPSHSGGSSPHSSFPMSAHSPMGPGMSSSSTVFGSSGMSGVSGVGGMSGVGGISGMSGMPMTPGMSGMPGMPGMPSVGGVMPTPSVMTSPLMMPRHKPHVYSRGVGHDFFSGHKFVEVKSSDPVKSQPRQQQQQQQQQQGSDATAGMMVYEPMISNLKMSPKTAAMSDYERKTIMGKLSERDLDTLLKAQRYFAENMDIEFFDISSNMVDVYFSVHKIESENMKKDWINGRKAKIAAYAGGIQTALSLLPFPIAAPTLKPKIETVLDSKTEFFSKQYDAIQPQRRQPATYSDSELFGSLALIALSEIKPKSTTATAADKSDDAFSNARGGSSGGKAGGGGGGKGGIFDAIKGAVNLIGNFSSNKNSPLSMVASAVGSLLPGGEDPAASSGSGQSAQSPSPVYSSSSSSSNAGVSGQPIIVSERKQMDTSILQSLPPFEFNMTLPVSPTPSPLAPVTPLTPVNPQVQPQRPASTTTTATTTAAAPPPATPRRRRELKSLAAPPKIVLPPGVVPSNTSTAAVPSGLPGAILGNLV